MRGGEKVVEALCKLLPDADLFTLFYDPAQVSEAIRARTVRTSFLQPARRFYRSLLPLMPTALENLDLRGYDLVISSESGPAKGVILPSTTRHVCYCHSPMRYLWELYPAYRNHWTSSALKRLFMSVTSPWLRTWDFATAARVDEFVANSDNVSRRIWHTYRRDSTVVYPPVAVESFYHRPAEDYFLCVSELIPYKRVINAVRVFSRAGRKLRVVGQGPEYKALRREANQFVEFCGRVSDSELRDLYARSTGFVMCAEEDFGIAAVEAMASGKPVIALGRGGALETVPRGDPLGGILYQEPTDESLARALQAVDAVLPLVDERALCSYATRFSEQRFLSRMEEIVFGQQPVIGSADRRFVASRT